MIPPTPGRILWFYPSLLAAQDGAQPQAAICAFVRNERCVNIALFDSNGDVRPEMNVTLVQEGDQAPSDRGFCCWMPYQQNQAKREADSPRLTVADVQKIVGELLIARDAGKVQSPPPANAGGEQKPSVDSSVEASKPASPPKQVTK